MKSHRHSFAFLLLSALLIAAASRSTAQQYKMTTPIAPGVATPDKIDTSIGTLHMPDGNPDAGTVKRICDNLEQSCALQAYLLAIPLVNLAGMHDSLRKTGPDKDNR